MEVCTHFFFPSCFGLASPFDYTFFYSFGCSFGAYYFVGWGWASFFYSVFFGASCFFTGLFLAASFGCSASLGTIGSLAGSATFFATPIDSSFLATLFSFFWTFLTLLASLYSASCFSLIFSCFILWIASIKTVLFLNWLPLEAR